MHPIRNTHQHSIINHVSNHKDRFERCPNVIDASLFVTADTAATDAATAAAAATATFSGIYFGSFRYMKYAYLIK